MLPVANPSQSVPRTDPELSDLGAGVTVWIVLAIVAAILAACLVVLAVVGPRRVFEWLGLTSPREIQRPSRRGQRFGGPSFQPSSDMRARVADLRWRAAAQILYSIGALKAPGLLRKYVEDADDPVQSVANLVTLLGGQPDLVFGDPGSFNRDRESFLDRLDAFCVLEGKIGQPHFPQAYRDEVLGRLQSGDFGFAQQLASCFAAAEEARSRFEAAHEYEGQPPFQIVSLAAAEGAFSAFERGLLASPPADVRNALSDAEAFNAAAAGFLELARETLSFVNDWEELSAELAGYGVGDAWAKAQIDGVAALADRFDRAVAGIYADAADLRLLFAHLDRLRDTITELAATRDAFAARFGHGHSKAGSAGGSSSGDPGAGRRGGSYGSPPPRSDGMSEAEIWTYFGFTNLAPGTRPEAEKVKAEYRRRAKVMHPDLASNPAQKQRSEEGMKELNAKYDQARKYLGVKVDRRV